MDGISQLTRFLLILIPTGGAARVIYCLCAAHLDSDDATSYKKRAWNVVAFIIIAEGLVGLLSSIMGYYR